MDKAKKRSSYTAALRPDNVYRRLSYSFDAQAIRRPEAAPRSEVAIPLSDQTSMNEFADIRQRPPAILKALAIEIRPGDLLCPHQPRRELVQAARAICFDGEEVAEKQPPSMLLVHDVHL